MGSARLLYDFASFLLFLILGRSLNRSNLTCIVSRGFNIDNIQEDGVASSVSITAQGTLGFSKEFTDLEFYDRVEVLRGVAGLTQSNGEPGGTVNLVRKRPGDELWRYDAGALGVL